MTKRKRIATILLAELLMLAVILSIGFFSIKDGFDNNNDDNYESFSDDEVYIDPDIDELTDSEYVLYMAEYDDGSGQYVLDESYAPGSETLTFDYPGFYTYTYRSYASEDANISGTDFELVSEPGTYMFGLGRITFIRWIDGDMNNIDVDNAMDSNSNWTYENGNIVHVTTYSDKPGSLRKTYVKKDNVIIADYMERTPIC